MENLKTNSKGIQYSSPNYNKESEIAKHENNDCVVRSIASAFDIKYDEAHAFCKDTFNRKDKKGTKAVTLTLDKIKDKKVLGKKITRVTNYSNSMNVKQLRAERVRRGETTMVRYTVGRFLKDFTKGTYILIVRKHAFTIKDNVVYGNTEDSVKTNTIVESAFKIS